MVSSEEQTQSKSKSKKLLESIKKGWKEHHESVQAAYEIYYGLGTPEGRLRY
jgi:hypothetical protein